MVIPHHPAETQLGANLTSTRTATGYDIDAPEVARICANGTKPAFSYDERFLTYHHYVEENDWGNARIFEHELAGETIYAVTVTTDGDDGFIETFDGRGQPLLSGTTGYGATGTAGSSFSAGVTRSTTPDARSPWPTKRDSARSRST